MTEKDQVWALFWCSLLRPLIEGEAEPEEAPRVLREIAAQEYLWPDGRRRKVSRSTLRRKWRSNQQGALQPWPADLAATGAKPAATRRRCSNGRSN